MLPNPLVTTLVCVAAAASTGIGQAVYRLVDLGAVPGGSGAGTTAVAMNELGDCVGWSTVGSAPHAFLYTDAQGIRDLGLLPGNVSAVARDVNELGEAVGESTWDSWRYTASGGLAAFAPNLLTQPLAINNAGTIVGTLNPGTFSPRPFAYTPGTGVVQFAGAVWGSAVDVNERGTIVGSWGGPGGSVYDQATGSQPLPTLAGFPSNSPAAINDAGQVAGNAVPLTGPSTWFRYTPGVGIVDVGRPGPFGGGLADMNGFGDLVGTHDSPVDRAFLYTDAAGFVDLNSLVAAPPGLTLRRGVAINDAGQILCEAYDGNLTSWRAVRLDPAAGSRPAWAAAVGDACGATAPRLDGDPPVLGGALTLRLTAGPASAAGLLAVALGRPVVSSLGSCAIYVDTAGALEVVVLLTDANGAAAWTLPVPNSTTLAGLALTGQAVVAGSAAPPGIDLSNGVAMLLGR